jgi:hypothetical protein
VTASLRTTIASLALIAIASPASAAEWKHEVAPYVWGSGMDGTTTVGTVAADVDMSFGDILDNLEVGFMGAYRATRDRWSVTVDGIYMGLGGHGRGPAGFVKADVDLDQTALEVDVGYEVIERLTVYGGLRYVDLSVNVDTSGPLGSQSGDMDENWVDPVIGLYYAIPFAGQWTATFRGDIGGFGIGSDFAWQGAATLRWQFAPRWGALAAYRYIDMDYENGKGSDYFRYDMAISGPALGVVFTF